MMKTKKKVCFIWLFFFAITITIFSFTSYASSKNFSEISEINTENLNLQHESWFEQEFVRSFIAVYRDKTFVITKEGKPTILGPKDNAEKNQWLEETAKDEFHSYVIAPKKNFKAILIKHKGKNIGAFLYRLLPEEKTVYLAQFFIVPEHQKKGIGNYFIKEILPGLHPEYKRFEVLTRHQNDAAMLLYNNAGYSIGDAEIVKKYDYDPLRYMSFYKVK